MVTIRNVKSKRREGIRDAHEKSLTSNLEARDRMTFFGKLQCYFYGSDVRGPNDDDDGSMLRLDFEI
jgi:hypothetical protein